MLRQSFQQKLLQKLSPAQIQLMKLLQLPITSLEQRIKEEMEINPALEDNTEEEIRDENEEQSEDSSDEEINEREEAPDGADNETAAKEEFAPEDYLDDDDDIAYYKLQVNNKGKDDEDRDMPMASSVSFQENLSNQLENLELNEQERIIAEYLLGCIDEDGYIRRELTSIVDDIAFSQNITTTTADLEAVLKMIQDEFDPAGIGAKDLQECLRLQLDRKKYTEARALALRIVNEQMEEFSKKHYSKIAKHFDLTEDQLKPALDEILKLNPRPGGSAKEGQRSILAIIPDFILANNNGALELSLNSRNAPDLHVSKIYQQMLNEYSSRKDKTGQEAVQFVRQKIEGAKSFINNIKERQNTLYSIMHCIMDYQKQYFMTGDELLLKPMILKDISDRIKLDISTVSRVTSTKYVQTNFGTILLKSLFNEALTNDEGEDVSSKMVKKIISDSIEAENKKKPLTDDALTKILNTRGYNIARRTVAKYREMLDIPVARMRKEI
ncbi:MAG: RNA polymerase sigma-54 factor [Bacteroidetes bacterium]|nr:MAG: RNA polymerase sigma-54 factor [Bacteroidota bacterium]